GVDHTLYPESYREDCLHYFFLAKDLSREEVAAIVLPKEELKSFSFVSIDEATKTLGRRIARRMKASIAAMKDGSTFYAENGSVI
ncbi:MAG: hypothetical protein AAB250_09610, partial [Bdellovibrionota bacterium]